MKRMEARAIVWRAAAALLFTAVGVRADTLPAPMYTALLGLNPGDDGTFHVTGGYGVTEIDCQFTVSCLSATLLPDSATMDLYGFAFETSHLQASVTYYWEIEGPQNNGIPIQISYANSYSAVDIFNSTTWAVSASLNETTNSGPIGNTAFCNSTLFPSCTPGTQTGVLSSSRFASNVIYQLTLQVAGEISNDSANGTGYVAATADPAISFGPGFDSTGYTIVVNDSAPLDAAPEPASFALIGIGLFAWLSSKRLRRG